MHDKDAFVLPQARNGLPELVRQVETSALPIAGQILTAGFYRAIGLYHLLTFRIFWSGSSTDQGGGKRPNGTSGSGYFQAAQAKLIDRLGTRVSFILGVHGDLGRQIAELIADVPAALAAI